MWFDPTIQYQECGCNSGVEYFVANEVVVGSNPTTRSKIIVLDIRRWNVYIVYEGNEKTFVFFEKINRSDSVYTYIP